MSSSHVGARALRRLAAAGVGLLAVAVTAAPAVAAPRTGLWIAKRGNAQLTFTVQKQGRELGNVTVACDNHASHFPFMSSSINPDHWRITKAGVVKGWPRQDIHGHQFPEPKLGHGSAKIVAPEGSFCGHDPRLTAKPTDPRFVRDGTWTLTTFHGITTRFLVLGGGVLAGYSGGDFAFPNPGDNSRACFVNIQWDDARINPDGSFHMTSPTDQGPVKTVVDGQFGSATTASGTFTSSEPASCGIFGSASGAHGSWTAALTTPANDGAPVAAGPRPPKPPPTPPEPKPGNGSPYAGPPAASSAAGCTPKVTAGELEGVAACWRTSGDVFTSDGRARVNGIDLTPARPGIAIKINRRSQRISSTGPIEVRIGALRLLRATIDWRSRKQIFSIKGKSAKKDEKPRFDLKSQEFLGLAVDGSAELSLEGGQTKLKVSVEVPDDPRLAFLKRFAGWSGELTAAANNDAGLVLDAAKLEFPDFTWGFVDIVDASLGVSRQSSGAYHWDGGATVYPFRTSTVGLIGIIGWGRGDGYFKLGAGAEQLNRPLFEGFFLQKLAFAAQRDPFGLNGSAGVTFGPQFRLANQLISSARLDGGFTYLSANGGDPRSIEFDGNLEVVEAHAGDGKVKVAGGKVDASGTFAFEKFGYGITGGMNGWFQSNGFDMEGNVDLATPGLHQGGEGVLSAVGVGGCRHGIGPDVGFGYQWGKGLGGLDIMGSSCDLGRWRQIRPAGSSQAGGQAVRVGRTRTLALQAIGQGGAPRVAFVSPSGRVYQPSSAAAGAFVDARSLLFQDAATQSEYLAVDAPARGTWKIQALPGSAPVVRVRSSKALPALRIRTRVSGRGSRRTLRYRIGHRGPANVTFFEQGRTSRKRIGTAHGARGRLRFRPATGAGGRRRIVAVIGRFGHPVGARRVGAYRTGRVHPPRPRRLRIARHGGTRVVSWRGPRGRYVVELRTSDGRKVRYVRTGARHRVSLGIVPRRVRVRARVVLTEAGVSGPAARASRR